MMTSEMTFSDIPVDEAVISPEVEPEVESFSENSPSVVFNTFEQALQVTGSFGPYQIYFMLTMQLTVVLMCGNYVFMPYATYEPDVYCFYANGTQSLQLDTKNSSEFCAKFDGNECDRLQWSAPFYTIVQQWKLICRLDYVPQMINTIQMAGMVLAVLFTGTLSDLYGRRTVFYISFLLFMVSTFAGTMAPNWQLLTICRFVVGGLLSACLILSFIWGMELTDQKHNVIMNLAGLWQFAYMITAGIAYLTGGWRPYLWVINVLGAPLLVIYPLFVESPRWLIQKGELEKAADHLNRMAVHNRKQPIKLTAANLTGIAQHKQADRRIRDELKSVFGDRVLLRRILLIGAITFATSSAVKAYVFQVSQEKNDPFLQFFLYGVFRLVIPPSLYLADRDLKWFGRRHMVILPLLVVTACFTVTITAQLLLADNKLSHQVASISLIAASVIANFLWAGINQYLVELFPTTVRNSTAALTHVLGPLAGVVIQILIYFEKFWPALPFVFCLLTLVLVTVASVVCLPETKGRQIPETLEDVHRGGGMESGGGRTWREMCVCGEEQLLLEDDGNDVLDGEGESSEIA